MSSHLMPEGQDQNAHKLAGDCTCGPEEVETGVWQHNFRPAPPIQAGTVMGAGRPSQPPMRPEFPVDGADTRRLPRRLPNG
jgi:hypothetical protein